MTMSSLVIVPVPTPAPDAILAATGLLRVTRNVSLISRSVSPSTLTLTVVLVWPAGMVAVPEVARKSTPDVAESLLVA